MLNVGQVLNRVKDEYADATNQVVPAPSLARHLSGYQRELMRKAFLINDNFKAQQASVVFDFTDSDDPAVVGRSTTGGLPVVVNSNGTYTILRTRTGSLIEYDFDKAARLVNERPVLAATANSVQALGTAWVVNAYANKLVRIVSGKGEGTAPRLVLSNTIDTLVATQNWELQPDATSTFEVIQAAPDASGEFGVATDSDPLDQRTGYLVREDANGIAYIDYTKPLRASFATGIPLPPHLRVIGGDVRYAPVNGQPRAASPLQLNTHGGRAQDRGLPAAFTLNGELYLAGSQRYWTQAISIDLRYVPIPPEVFLDGDFFLLDDAESVLVTRGVLFAHKQARARKIETADVPMAQQDFADAEAAYLTGLSGSQPATAFKRRDSFSRRFN